MNECFHIINDPTLHILNYYVRNFKLHRHLEDNEKYKFLGSKSRLPCCMCGKIFRNILNDNEIYTMYDYEAEDDLKINKLFKSHKFSNIGEKLEQYNKYKDEILNSEQFSIIMEFSVMLCENFCGSIIPNIRSVLSSYVFDFIYLRFYNVDIETEKLQTKLNNLNEEVESVKLNLTKLEKSKTQNKSYISRKIFNLNPNVEHNLVIERCTRNQLSGFKIHHNNLNFGNKYSHYKSLTSHERVKYYNEFSEICRDSYRKSLIVRSKIQHYRTMDNIQKDLYLDHLFEEARAEYYNSLCVEDKLCYVVFELYNILDLKDYFGLNDNGQDEEGIYLELHHIDTFTKLLKLGEIVEPYKVILSMDGMIAFINNILSSWLGYSLICQDEFYIPDGEVHGLFARINMFPLYKYVCI